MSKKATKQQQVESDVAVVEAPEVDDVPAAKANLTRMHLISDQAYAQPATKVTAGSLAAFIEGNAADLAAVGHTRLQSFLTLIRNTTRDEFDDAIAEYLKPYRKAAKDMGKDAPETKAKNQAAVRCSECSALFTAVQHGLILGAGNGYHAAITAARDYLKSIKLKPNGKPVLSEEQQEAAKEDKLFAEAYEEVGKTPNAYQTRAERIQLAESMVPVLRAAKEAEAAKKLQEKLQDVAGDIVAKGHDYAMILASGIFDLLGYDVTLTKRPDTDPPM